MINFWSFFLKKTQFSILLAVALLIFGLSSLMQMPKESAPTVEMPMAIVLTTMIGSPATDIENLVTNILEPPLKNNLSDIKSITSKSSNNISNIVVEFTADANIKDSLDKLRDEVDRAKQDLPTDASEPQIIQIDFTKQPIMTLEIAADLPTAALLKLSEQVEDELIAIDGVSSVKITGIPDEEVHILVNKELITSYGLLLSDVVSAIKQQNVTLPSGDITLNNSEYPVRFNGNINDASMISSLPIRGNNGAVVTVGDVATVVDGFAKRKFISRLSIDGDPSHTAFSIDIYKSSSAQLTQVSASIHAKLKELKQEGQLLYNIPSAVSFDSGKMLSDDLRTLGLSGLTTVFLVMSILFFTIGWREAIVAGVAIPLSFLTAFIGIKYSGNSLNFVSLFALILSTGIIVDSAIVVVEGINSHMHNDPSDQSKVRAAFKAITEYHSPLTSGTLTTIAVFAPLFIISGITGQFISAIPFTIIFVLLAALFNALAIIPVLASMLLTRKESTSKLTHKREEMLKFIHKKYRTFLYNFLSDRRNSIALSSILAILFVGALALPITGAVRTLFFPEENSDYVYVETKLKPGSTLNSTDIEMRKIEDIIYSIDNIKTFSTITGRSTTFSNNFSGPVSGKTLGGIVMTISEDSPVTSSDLVLEIRDKLKHIKSSDILVGQLEGGPPTGAPISITLYGDNFKDLDTAAELVMYELEQIPGTTGVTASNEDATLEFLIDIDRSQSISSFVTPMTIASSLNAAISGIEATSIKQLGKSKPVIVQMDLSGDSSIEQASNTTVDTLRYLPILNSSTEIGTGDSQILLGSFTSTALSKNRSVIRHKDTQRISVVSSYLDDGANSSVITSLLKKRLDEAGPLPAGVEMEIGGENEDVDQSFADMFTALAIGMTLMFAILVIQFNSFKQTIFILMTVPLSLIGVFAGLLIMDKALSFPAIMGFIALAGIVVNNGIILIDVINQRIANSNGREDLLDAVVGGATSRLRPVLLTAITTVIGILPLVFAAGMWAPLAYSIIFGLTFATVLTLLLIPALYYRWPS